MLNHEIFVPRKLPAIRYQFRAVSIKQHACELAGSYMHAIAGGYIHACKLPGGYINACMLLRAYALVYLGHLLDLNADTADTCN